MSGTRYSESTLDEYMRMAAGRQRCRAPGTGGLAAHPDLRAPAHGPKRVAVIAPRDRGQRPRPARPAEEGEPWGGALPADPCDVF